MEGAEGAAVLAILLVPAAGPGQESYRSNSLTMTLWHSKGHPPSPQLKFVLIFSRHGVRSPIWTEERLNQYSREAWPKWNVPPGLLTPHGEKLMRLFGAYDRATFARAGLPSASRGSPFDTQPCGIIGLFRIGRAELRA
jgi:hypothetical protein